MDSEIISEDQFWFAMGRCGKLSSSLNLLMLREVNVSMTWEDFYKTHIQPMAL
jgi:hypothetical protein